jgi:hypothetical protein
MCIHKELNNVNKTGEYKQYKKLGIEVNMKFNWKNWCGFCGSSATTTKFEASSALLKIFKV